LVLFYTSSNILKLFYCIAYLSSNHSVDMNIKTGYIVIVYPLQSICQTKNGRPPAAINAWKKLKHNNIYFGQLLINHFDWPTTGNILLLSSLFLPLQSIDAFYSKSFPIDFFTSCTSICCEIYFAPFFCTYNIIIYKYAIWMTYSLGVPVHWFTVSVGSGGGGVFLLFRSNNGRTSASAHEPRI